ncbi:hypothetical protein [Cystobacter fuscus]|uniref:hypothetical protein n=1 Tax=Cystobacter fuscus TaxID=43 RepID=UPI002B2B9ADD|nr:hypothetical protein F0U63_33840 [Cystobacter fuscus]
MIGDWLPNEAEAHTPGAPAAGAASRKSTCSRVDASGLSEDEFRALMNELNDLVMQQMGQSPLLAELHRVPRHRIMGRPTAR